MNRSLRFAALLAAALAACDDAAPDDEASPHEGHIVAAVEAEGVLAVIDQVTGRVVRRVDISPVVEGMRIPYAIHNVQGAPDGRTVWATTMPAGAHGGHVSMPLPDELVGVDLETGAVIRRIPLGRALHIAHVVLDGPRAFVTANQADVVLVVDLERGAVRRRVDLARGSGPHGARLTPDGGRLVVAGMGDGSLHVVDTVTGAVTAHDLPGVAVQTAVLPDGSAAFATLFDTRQVARLDLATDAVRLFDLPPDSAGPLQIYPHPDGGSVWVADQGVLLDRPAGRTLFRLDAATGEVLASVPVGEGPHGVVVTPDGASVWVTLLVDGSVQRVDVADGEVAGTVPVGDGPNGITCLHPHGAMP